MLYIIFVFDTLENYDGELKNRMPLLYNMLLLCIYIYKNTHTHTHTQLYNMVLTGKRRMNEYHCRNSSLIFRRGTIWRIFDGRMHDGWQVLFVQTVFLPVAKKGLPCDESTSGCNCLPVSNKAFSGTELFVLQKELHVNPDINDEDYVTCFIWFTQLLKWCFTWLLQFVSRESSIILFLLVLHWNF